MRRRSLRSWIRSMVRIMNRDEAEELVIKTIRKILCEDAEQLEYEIMYGAGTYSAYKKFRILDKIYGDDE